MIIIDDVFHFRDTLIECRLFVQPFAVLYLVAPPSPYPISTKPVIWSTVAF